VEYFDKNELRRLFKIAHDNNKQHHLCLVVALWHGFRISEVTGQFIDDPQHPYHHPGLRGTDICDGQISMVRLKRSHPTCHPIHADADPLFDETPVIELAAKNSGRLFPFSRQRADQFIKRYGKMAGLHPSKAHMHALKHSIAMLLWDKTHDLGQIGGYIGHRAPGSTMCYLVEADRRKAYSAVAGMTI
jgi:integrase